MLAGDFVLSFDFCLGFKEGFCPPSKAKRGMAGLAQILAKREEANSTYHANILEQMKEGQKVRSAN